MSTNLPWETYYVVEQPFAVYVRRGHVEANAYFGASQLLASVFERVKLRKGDQVGSYAGGVQVIRGRKAFMAQYTLEEKGFFEKRYGQRIDHWPVQNMREIPAEGRRRFTPKNGNYRGNVRDDLKFTREQLGGSEKIGENFIATTDAIRAAELTELVEAK